MLFGSPSNVLLSGPSVCPRVAFENPTNGLAVGFSLPPPAPYTVVKPRFSWHFVLLFLRRSIATGECKGESVESLRNRLLFSPNAPPSFLRNLVRKLGTPMSSAVCAQVRVV